MHKPEEIIFHFNKGHLQDPSIPMWVIKTKGQTHYVHHVNVEKGVGFSTKETPDNPNTKGSIKFKGILHLISEGDLLIANITNN